jgi:hypothetical protein
MRLPDDLVADLIRAVPLADAIQVVDVGASALASSEKPPYEPLLAHGIARRTSLRNCNPPTSAATCPMPSATEARQLSI